MKGIIIGLGSMGKRRIRNLSKIPGIQLCGFDVRLDRVNEVAHNFGIPCFNNFNEVLKVFSPNFLIISTPPDSHIEYIYSAIKMGVDCFVEASVMHPEKLRHIDQIRDNLIVAPSCTMFYFPGPKLIRKLVNDGAIGRVLNINYHVGQYLPDWHPWESVNDFYVSKRETGGAREIVPFELTWLSKIFRNLKPLACIRGSLGDFNLDIDDIYHSLLRFQDGFLNMTIDVLSRPVATREINIIGAQGLIRMGGTPLELRVETVGNPPEIYKLDHGICEPGYIYSDKPYEEEMLDFIKAIQTRNELVFPNSLAEDATILDLLTELEALSI